VQNTTRTTRIKWEAKWSSWRCSWQISRARQQNVVFKIWIHYGSRQIEEDRSIWQEGTVLRPFCFR
jgi:hypothetical protein